MLVYALPRSKPTNSQTVAHLSDNGKVTLCRKACDGMLYLGKMRLARALSECGWKLDHETECRLLCNVCLRRARERKIKIIQED
jgi:hypothetical protein